MPTPRRPRTATTTVPPRSTLTTTKPEIRLAILKSPWRTKDEFKEGDNSRRCADCGQHFCPDCAIACGAMLLVGLEEEEEETTNLVPPPTEEDIEQRRIALRAQLPCNAPESMIDRLARQQMDVEARRAVRQKQRRRLLRRRRKARGIDVSGSTEDVAMLEDEGDVTDYEDDFMAASSSDAHILAEGNAIAHRQPGELPGCCMQRLPSAIGEAAARKRRMFLPFD